MIIRKGDRIYDIRWNYGHSDLYCNGEFLQSCTDEDEAYQAIEELEGCDNSWQRMVFCVMSIL